MKNTKRTLLSLLLICGFAFSAIAQYNQISCYHSINQVDRILKEKDTLTAVLLFEAISQKDVILSNSRHYQFSIIYHNLGEIEKSKQQLRIAVDKGFLGGIGYDPDSGILLKAIKNKHGHDFLQKMLMVNQNLMTKKLMKYGGLIKELRHIYESDQVLRRNKKYKECKSYNFRYRLGFAYDTTKNHVEMMACFNEFRVKDSTLLQRFVDIVDSLGYVPGDEMIFNMLPLSPIINHTAHFNFANLEQLYLRSLKRGTLSPRIYAWYHGYRDEYYKREFHYYFTNGEDSFKEFTPEKIEAINKRRFAIGLAQCPAVIWNTRNF